MSKTKEDQHLELVLDHLPYLSPKKLDQVIIVAHAWQTLAPHYEHTELAPDETARERDERDI